MRAAQLVNPKTFQLIETPPPSCPDDGLILAVHACGVCGSDLRRWREGPPPAGPVVPGHEVSGCVVAVGPRHQKYSIGNRLALAPDIHCGQCYYCRRGLYNLCDDLRLVGITFGYPGGFSEQMALTAEILDRGIVHPVPAGLSDDCASLAEPLSSVLASHDQSGTAEGDLVVVMGAGPIGCLHVLVARTRGARVIVSEPSAFRREAARPFAPLAIVDPSTEDLAAIVRGHSGGVGADIVICANPVAATQTQAVQITRKRGQVVLFGGLPKLNPMTMLDGNLIHYGERRVIGAFSYHPRFHAQALAELAAGGIDGRLLISHRFALSAINEAFAAADSGAGLKVVITFNQD